MEINSHYLTYISVQLYITIYQVIPLIWLYIGNHISIYQVIPLIWLSICNHISVIFKGGLPLKNIITVISVLV
jgi:hypothetical protein